MNIKDTYTFRCNCDHCVVIKGIEYNEIKTSYSDNPYLFINIESLKNLDITNKNDQDEFFRILKEDNSIDGFIDRGAYCDYLKDKNISYNGYKFLIYNILKREPTNEEKSIGFWFKPIHKIRKSEVEAVYNYKTTIVLNGIETESWEDGAEPSTIVEHFFSYLPDHIVLSDSQHINSIPSDQIQHLVKGHPRDMVVGINIIPKKYFDKVILYRNYLNPDYFVKGKWEYTGDYDKWELDLNNPDPKILKLMEQKHICRKK
ncbi:MAG: hypothetical protein IKP37_10265 [Paludibacteraceae bacterium]|nr:hypothetical protein [Paludibacteraceae bacterium]